MTTITITELTNIGSNIAYTSLVPVVNMTGTPETQKANLQIIGNLILSQAGGNFVVAAKANTVVNAAQANITSIGTLTSLAVTGNITSGNVQGTTHSGTTGTFTGNVTTGNISGTTGTFTNVGGTLTTAAQTNITSVGTLTGLNVANVANLGSLTTSNINSPSNINVTASGNTWVFGINGNLTLPGNTSSVNNTNGTPYGSTVIVTAAATGAQTITNAASAQVLAWTEISDTSNSFAGNIFTAPFNGFYQVNLSLYWGAGVTQTAGFVSAVINPTGSFTTVDLLNGATNLGAIQNVSRLIQLSQDDELEFLCAQTTGSDQTPLANGTTLSIYRIG